MNKTTEKAIAKIHEFERFGINLGLERMTRLLGLLGNPQDELKAIHVAGTNGKGSVCRYIYSVLQTEGYKTGLYTSPFLEKFNERIEFDGSCISDEDLALYTDRVLAKVKEMTDGGEESPTEFEVVTVIALLYFKEKNCDYVILEVGLGGIGDSTNVCKEPLMTVITSISMDHMDRLGNTIEEIAREKAGIIKDECPVVTSAKNPKALEVIENTAAEHSSMFFETRGLPVTVKEETWKGSKFDVDIQGIEFKEVEISMVGAHQVENAVAAMCAISIMEERGDITVSRESLYAGLKNARHKGRLEFITGQDGQAITVIDGAHNQDGATALADAVTKLCSGKKTLMVAGMLADKDADGILKQFVRITKDFVVTEPDNPRKLAADELAVKLEALGGRCIVQAEPEKAYQEAVQASSDYDMVIYAGSLYLIGQIRTLIYSR